MGESTASISLVERKKYDEKLAHQVFPVIWWLGYLEPESQTSHNPYLLVDDQEGVLINPGSRADDLYRIVRDKAASVINPERIQHLVVLHQDPERCASLPLFAKAAGRNVRLYAPARIARSIRHYGCKQPIIALEDGENIILKSGRSLEYHDTPHLSCAGSGFLYDSRTGTVFSGNLLDCPAPEWNLFAPPNAWESLASAKAEEKISKKALLMALNKIERLSPERICPHSGPIIEEEIDKYLAAARDRAAG